MKKSILILYVIIFGIDLHSQHNTYYIGHSGFGWELMVGEMVNDLAQDAGISSYDYNYQQIGGSCISIQWEQHTNPQVGTDSHEELATGAYDLVIIAEQIPISEVIDSSPWGCNLTSYDALDRFYDLAKSANPSSKIYLMEFWNEFDRSHENAFEEWSDLNTELRPLWLQVIDSVSRANNTTDIALVPVAPVMQALADSIIDGRIPEIDDWLSLFDPNDVTEATIHPTEVGYYLVALVHYILIFGENPIGLTNETFHQMGWQFDPPSPDLARKMQEIAWAVVNNDPSYQMTSEILSTAGTYHPFKYYITDHDINIEGNEQMDIKIINLNGKEIFSVRTNSISIDIREFPKGLYILKVGNKYGILSKKFIN